MLSSAPWPKRIVTTKMLSCSRKAFRNGSNGYSSRFAVALTGVLAVGVALRTSRLSLPELAIDKNSPTGLLVVGP